MSALRQAERQRPTVSHHARGGWKLPQMPAQYAETINARGAEWRGRRRLPPTDGHLRPRGTEDAGHDDELQRSRKILHSRGLSIRLAAASFRAGILWKWGEPAGGGQECSRTAESLPAVGS